MQDCRIEQDQIHGKIKVYQAENSNKISQKLYNAQEEIMVKEVLCMPHSHLDIGYTHPQPMLMEQQVDYVNQVLELMKETEDYPEETRFRWTMEAS